MSTMSSDVQDVQDVQDVRGDVQDVRATRFKVSTTGCKALIGIDVKIRPGQPFVISLTFAHCSEYSDSFTGNQLRDSLLRWLSPPNPSINHNNACKAHHNGTAQWFFQGSIFNQWKSTGSFLWVHGKRALLLGPHQASTPDYLLFL
jgi:hypothetical protein